MLIICGISIIYIIYKHTLEVCSPGARLCRRQIVEGTWVKSSADYFQQHDGSWNSTKNRKLAETREWYACSYNTEQVNSRKYSEYSKYEEYAESAKYAKYIPVLPVPCESLFTILKGWFGSESLFTILKGWFGSIDTVHMPNCAVEHEIIVCASHSTSRILFTINVFLRNGWWTEKLILFFWPTVDNAQNT